MAERPTRGARRPSPFQDPAEPHLLSRAEFMRRAGALGLIVAGGVPLLAACTSDDGQSAASSSVPTGKLRIHIRTDIKNADPGDVYDSSDGTVISLAYEDLVRFAPDTTDLENWLALTWEPSEDLLSYHFTLHEGVLFHGGHGEMTAEDVKYSFERIAGLNGEDHSYQTDWEALKEVKVDGKYEGTIILKDTYAPLMTTTIPASSGSIVSQRAAAELGKDFRTHPIGTGPYELSEHKPKESISFTRFEDYWGPKPAWDEIELVIISEASAIEIALETEELDFAGVSIPVSKRLASSGEFEVQQRTTFDQTWIGMNMENPKLQDINVRQAIRYAIDVPSIILAAYEDGGVRATAVVSPSMPIGYWADAPTYDRDLDKAKQYAAEAQLDGLELQFATGVGNQAKTVAEIVQANLAEIGISITIAQDESLFDLGPGLRDLELFLVTYYGAPDPIWSTQWFRCAQFDKWNWMYFCNEEFDSLDRAAANELDPEKRNEMYIREQQLMDEGVEAVWILWPSSTTVTRTGIQPSFDVSNSALAWNFKPS